MSMSSKPALAPEPKITGFPYAEVSSLSDPTPEPQQGPIHVDATADREQMAREAGRREAEEQLRMIFTAELSELRAQLQQAVQDFARERKAYYERVEGEVVQLALAIARKILHREAQVDPLLLAGLVRVALEKIDRSTKASLRVHPQHASEWRTYFAQHFQPEETPEIVEDRTLEGDRCILETTLGRTDLGIEVQLKEIEKGLLDLLAERPQSKV